MLRRIGFISQPSGADLEVTLCRTQRAVSQSAKNSSRLQPDIRPMRRQRIWGTNGRAGGGQQNLAELGPDTRTTSGRSTAGSLLHRRGHGIPVLATPPIQLSAQNRVEICNGLLLFPLCTLSFQMLYFYDLELVHAFIFIVPCLLLSLAKVIIKS